MEEEKDDFANIFCDSFFSGEQDHWLFDQPLSSSIDIAPADVFSCNIDKSCDYGDILSDCSEFVSPTIKNEAMFIPTPVPMAVDAQSFAPAEGLDSRSVVEKEILSSFTGEGVKIRLPPEGLNLMEGLTEFIPWTGFDYSSDGEFEEDEADDVTSGGVATKKKRKRTSQKQPSSDADLIATATEENLRKLGIDPDSNEGKKQRRKIRNRLSAQLHRERKKGYISYLEGLVKERDVKLSTVSIDMSRILSENGCLRLKLEMASDKRDQNRDYSSGTGQTDSDTGEDSDTVSVSSETATAATTATSISEFTPKRSYKIGSRFKGSKIGSAFSVFSAVLMISITIFGPYIQNMNTEQYEPDGSPLLISIAESHDVIMPSFVNPDSDELLTLDLDSQNKQLIPRTSRRKLLTTSANDYEGTEQSDRTRSTTPLNGIESDATSMIPVISSVSNRLIFSSKNSALLSKNQQSQAQALWHFHDHITDLYPPFEKYYSPNTESSGNYTTGKIEVHINERKHLRRRVANNTSIPVEDESMASDMIPRVQESSNDMGKNLVSVHSLMSPEQSPSTNTAHSSRQGSRPSNPSIELAADATTKPPHTSVSRILLTQGRALLDPSLVMRPPQRAKSTVVPTPKEDTVKDALLKTLSTWTGGRSSDEPPVVRVGVSPVDSQSSAGNMLVMLLPASAVRWGKNWGDSSEGTMEAMLKGLNFTDSTYDAHGRNMGGESGSGSGESDEGMWVEIGCSVFRAQLVRNVTLSS